MDAEELKFSRRKLAIETRLKRRDQEIARKQLTLGTGASKGWQILFTPTGAAVTTAILALAGIAVGKFMDYLATRQQAETSLILKAIDVPSSYPADQQIALRARNLLWFAELRLINLPPAFIQRLRDDSSLAPGQLPSTPLLQPSSSQPAGISLPGSAAAPIPGSTTETRKLHEETRIGFGAKAGSLIYEIPPGRVYVSHQVFEGQRIGDTTWLDHGLAGDKVIVDYKLVPPRMTDRTTSSILSLSLNVTTRPQ